MAPIPKTLLERLRQYRAAAFVADDPLPVRALQKELALIPDERIRQGALERFHILRVCASVMKLDRNNYHRAVGRAFDNLVRYLESSGLTCQATKPEPTFEAQTEASDPTPEWSRVAEHSAGRSPVNG